MVHTLVVVGSIILVLAVICLAAVFCAPSLEDMDVDRP